MTVESNSNRAEAPVTRRMTAEQLQRFAASLLRAAGLDREKASVVADKLVESDLLGHRTHGLAMLPVYLERLADGRIATAGEIEVVSDSGAAFLWQARRLPGAWVASRAVTEALMRIEQHPVVTASVANCSHIGCLQTYLEAIGRQRLLGLLMVTDPGLMSVAPFGGIDPVITTNPMAVCIPTRDDPILIDQCTSLVSNAAVAQRAAAGERLPSRWLVDNQGNATDDPAALSTEPPGTIMPLGGEEFGYKGFGLGLIVEAFALALSGHGRIGSPPRGSQGVFLQVIDPDRFCGRDAFLAETTELVRRCKASRVAGTREIRLPGERALREKAEQLVAGVLIDAGVIAALNQWARRLNVEEIA